MAENEKQFESNIEAFLISPDGGYEKATDAGYASSSGIALDIHTLVGFVKATQPTQWQRFEKQCNSDPYEKFYKCFEDAVQMDGLLSVMRHGFKHRGMDFKVCYFKPESTLNDVAVKRYKQNVCQCIRQWHYSEQNNNSVDMMLAINGIPVVAIELKNQLTGQTVDNAKLQWQYDRDQREPAFWLNHRILAYFAVDLYEAWMATELKGADTYFLPFNQGSNGAGNDGGAGNPQAEDDNYVTSYIWENVLQKDSLLDIIQKFISFEVKTEKKDGKNVTKKRLIFPRFHQLDVVRKLIADVRENGSGNNYLIQHSAGSGKSNSIAWTAYRLASLHNDDNEPVFTSVVIVTDRRNLDAQLQETITGFDHTIGSVCAIDEKKSSKDLKDALNAGKRIIVTTLQKFPVIYEEVDDTTDKRFAIIVDEAHSSQTGSSAMKLKAALADVSDALKEYAELEGKAEDELLDDNDRLVHEMISHGKHKLSSSDILKAENLKELSAADRTSWATRWEEMETYFGEDFDKFLSHIRTILVKKKQTTTLLKEFDEFVYSNQEYDRTQKKYVPRTPILRRGRDTFELLYSYYHTYQEVFDTDHSVVTGDYEITNYLKLMETGFGADYWIAPVLDYYRKYRRWGFVAFLKALDRKLSADWITAATPTVRMENVNAILREIEASQDSAVLLQSKTFTINKSDFERVINGDIYGRSFAKYLLLKLDLIYRGSSTPMIPQAIASIEHILPRNPSADSQWVKDFSAAEREEWTNKLGNLVLISRRKNTSQGNRDYVEKKEKYFEKNIEMFPNSIRIYQNYPEWKLSDLKKNHSDVVTELLNVY